jgi:hypothetical protein
MLEEFSVPRLTKIIACVCLLLSLDVAWAETGKLIKHGVIATYLTAGKPNQRVWYDDINITNSTGAYIALEVGLEEESSCEINVEAVNQQDGSSFRLNCSSIPRQKNIIWSNFVYGSLIRVSVKGDASNLSLSIPYYAVPDKKYMTESIVGDRTKPDIISIADSRNSKVYDLKDSVVHLRLFEKDSGYYPCTGFVIDGKYILTAAHCVGSNTIGVQAYFGWDNDKISPSIVSYNPKPVSSESVIRDYALLGPLIGGVPSHVKSLVLSSKPVDKNGDLSMIHHPGGGPKMATLTDCSIKSYSAPASLLHSCDAIEGSSGAPIFDESLNVVALHTQGFTEASDNQLNTAVSAYIVKEHIEGTRK